MREMASEEETVTIQENSLTLKKTPPLKVEGIVRTRNMEEYMSAMPHPALLDLRGHFHLEPGLSVHDTTWPPDYPMEVFPITDELAVLVRFQNTSLIDLASGEVRWTIIVQRGRVVQTKELHHKGVFSIA